MFGRSKITGKIFFYIAIILFVISCSEVVDNDSTNTGSVALNIKAESLTKTLQPGIDLNVASYDITGIGPGTASFSMSDVNQSVGINNLAIGSWTIIVNGKNSDGKNIAAGSVEVNISVAVTRTADVTLTPLSGQGTLDLSLSWTSPLPNPDIEAVLTPVGESGANINVNITGETASYQNTALNAGYYILTLRLKDGANEIWGITEAVQILANETTIGSFLNIATPPEIPSWITASDGTSGVKVELSWENIDGVDKYYVFRSSTSDGTYTEIGSSVNNSFEDTNIEEFVNYYYKVKSFNQSGLSSLSVYDVGYRRETRYDYTKSLSFNTADIASEITVNALYAHNGILYTGHWDGGNSYKFDGATWTKAALNKPYVGINPIVGDFCSYDNGSGETVYAISYSGAYGGRGGVFRYDSGLNNWMFVKGLPSAFASGEVPYTTYNACVFNGKMYVSTGLCNGIDAGIYEYTSGTSWTKIFSSSEKSFKRMVVYDGKLYVIAYQSSPTKNTELYSYDGSTWSGPLCSLTRYPNGMAVYNGKIYLTGESDVYTYDGNNLSHAKTFDNNAYSFAVMNSKLYVSTRNKVYVHEGSDPTSNWALDMDFESLNPLGIYALSAYNGKLYAGLKFSNFRAGMTYETSAQIYVIEMLAW